MFDIEPYRINQKIMWDTALQIQKDFGKYDLEIHFAGETYFAYSELYQQLCMQLANLVACDFGRVMSLLYQIDVDENAFSEAEKNFPDFQKHEIMAELIIRREMQKVVTRMYFSQQNSNKQ
ncbi:MAG: hypothetical protein M0R21_00100 [Lentimicrobiaceae bacterium]|nr:hypothetical protein [Lentimicrobiaceae bacterium]